MEVDCPTGEGVTHIVDDLVTVNGLPIVIAALIDDIVEDEEVELVVDGS